MPASAALPALNLAAYLTRLRYTGPTPPTLATLRALQRAHMEGVPFENLDIHLGRPIVLDEGRLFTKIVAQRRGGFCFELNGLFAWLLRQLGFEVNLLSARVYENGAFQPEFDHLTLLVTLGADRWVADVGFGDSALEPLRLVPEQEQTDGRNHYRFLTSGTDWLLQEHPPGQTEWATTYLTTLIPRQLQDFAPRCTELQTAPTSIFTQKRICTRATPTGRLSLSEARLITTVAGQKQEQVLETPAACLAVLAEQFDIHLPNWPPILYPYGKKA